MRQPPSSDDLSRLDGARAWDIAVFAGTSSGLRHPAKLAQRLAEEIERDIVENHVPGDHLGNEADLMGRFKVSRSILREALILVETSGLAEIRRGKKGGLIVSPPSQDLVAAGLQNFIGAIATEFDDIRAARREVEDLMLSLAINRFDPGKIGVFEDLAARYREHPSITDRSTLAHEMLRALAMCTRNPFLQVLVLALSAASADRVDRYPGGAERVADLSNAIVALRHEQLAAVVAADRGRALSANRDLHAKFGEMLERLNSNASGGDAVAPRDAAWRPLPGAGDSRKLSDAVARHIRARIARERLPEEALLGSEQELMAQYRVSRGILREAIRILERYSIVRMARGKTGGLRVMAPNPEALVRTASLYLRSLQVAHRDNHELGEVMGLVAVERAARNVRDFSHDELANVLAPLSQLQGATLRELAFAHYNAIGRLSGSPSIGLIMSIHANLFALDDDKASDEVIVREVVPDRMSDLLAAILQGNVDLARRRMIILQRTGVRVRALSLNEIVRPRLLDILRPSDASIGPPRYTPRA